MVTQAAQTKKRINIELPGIILEKLAFPFNLCPLTFPLTPLCNIAKLATFYIIN